MGDRPLAPALMGERRPPLPERKLSTNGSSPCCRSDSRAARAGIRPLAGAQRPPPLPQQQGGGGSRTRPHFCWPARGDEASFCCPPQAFGLEKYRGLMLSLWRAGSENINEKTPGELEKVKDIELLHGDGLDPSIGAAKNNPRGARPSRGSLAQMSNLRPQRFPRSTRETGGGVTCAGLSPVGPCVRISATAL